MIDMSDKSPQPPSDSTEREFPTYWTPEMDAVARKYDFDLTLQLLGRLMVAFNHLEYRLYQAISYLINEQDFHRGDATLAYVRGLPNLLDLFKDLFAAKITEPEARQELSRLCNEIQEHAKTRNLFAHSRLLLPTKKTEAVALRIKTDDMSSAAHPVTLTQLSDRVKAIGVCDGKLSALCDKYLPDYGRSRMSALLRAILNGSISLE